MSDGRFGFLQLAAYMKEHKSVWFIAAALLIGIGMMLIGSPEKAAESVGRSGCTYDCTELEARTRSLCEGIAGVGHADVMITLADCGEQVYAKNSRSDSGGETEEFVTVSQGLVPVSERPPQVMGVAVVCTGGGSADVQLKLTELLCALFGIGAESVVILGGK